MILNTNAVWCALLFVLVVRKRSGRFDFHIGGQLEEVIWLFEIQPVKCSVGSTAMVFFIGHQRYVIDVAEVLELKLLAIHSGETECEWELVCITRTLNDADGFNDIHLD